MPLDYENNLELSESIETFLRKTGTKNIMRFGLIAYIISFALFIFSDWRIGENVHLLGYDLILKYKFATAIVIAFAHIFVIFVLLFKNFDKFQYATMLNFIVLVLQTYFELKIMPSKFSYVSTHSVLQGVYFVPFGLLISILCQIIFAIETYKTQPRAAFFKWVQKINYGFDHPKILDPQSKEVKDITMNAVIFLGSFMILLSFLLFMWEINIMPTSLLKLYELFLKDFTMISIAALYGLTLFFLNKKTAYRFHFALMGIIFISGLLLYIEYFALPGGFIEGKNAGAGVIFWMNHLITLICCIMFYSQIIPNNKIIKWLNE